VFWDENGLVLDYGITVDVRSCSERGKRFDLTAWKVVKLLLNFLIFLAKYC